MRTSRSNIRRLRAGLIGSISAWLPSRRSTAHHCCALSMTRSGQVRAASLIGSTSSATERERLTRMHDPRWVFQAGWLGWGGPTGLTMVREEVNASGDSPKSDWEKLEVLVTVIAPGLK